MVSSGLLRRVALVRTDVLEQHRLQLAADVRCEEIPFLHSVRRLLVAACVVPSSPIFGHPDERGARFLRNVGSYKSHTA
jgi:hypothetical protein